jgi:hypothetical protein
MRQNNTRVSRLLIQSSSKSMSMEVFFCQIFYFHFKELHVGKCCKVSHESLFANAIIRTRQSGACIIVSDCRDSGNEGIDIKLHKSQDRGI